MLVDVRYENEGYVSVTTKWYVLDAPDECTKLDGWDGGKGYLQTAAVWLADYDYTDVWLNSTRCLVLNSLPTQFSRCLHIH